MYYGNTCDRQHHVARFLTNRFLQNVVQRVGLYEHTIFVSLYTDDVWLPFTPKVLNFAPKMDSIFGILSISLEWVMHIWNLVHRLITANGSWMIINFTQRGCDEGQVTPFEFKDLMVFFRMGEATGIVFICCLIGLHFPHWFCLCLVSQKRIFGDYWSRLPDPQYITGLKGNQSTDTDEENHTLDLNLSSSISDSRRK